MPDHRNAQRALLAQMGGISGLIYSSLPVLVFVPVSSAFGLLPAIVSALGVATLVLAWRLLRRESTQPAVSGFIGVGICAAIAYVMGQSKGYFLLGIWSSLFYAGLFLGSVLVRRPLVGYIWGWIHDHDTSWRRARRAVLAYDIATLIWALVFLSRFIVQHYLYDIDKTGWLGVARIAMGWPLTAVAALATYFPIKAAQRATPRPSPDATEVAADAAMPAADAHVPAAMPAADGHVPAAMPVADAHVPEELPAGDTRLDDGLDEGLQADQKPSGG